MRSGRANGGHSSRTSGRWAWPDHEARLGPVGQAAAWELKDWCWADTRALAVARKLPSSNKPVRERARVMTAWAAPSPSSNRAMVLRLVMSSQAWW